MRQLARGPAAALALLLAGASLAVLPPVAAKAQEKPEIARLSLSAEGIATAVPDTAIVSAGVLAEKATAAEALDENNAAMGALVDELKSAGIAEKDIRTSNFSIEPVYVYPGPRADGEQEPPRITGYRVSNTVTVRIRDIAAAGGLLDRVVRLGANQIRGVEFAVSDDAALLDEARKRAIAEARRKAELYAEAGGFRLGRLLQVAESGGQMPMPAPMMRMEAAMADMKTVPVQAGEQEIRVGVQVQFEILPTP